MPNKFMVKVYQWPNGESDFQDEGHIRGFPKIDHSGIDARIVLEQHKIQQKSWRRIEPSTLGL